jgi:hypothetical protein
MTSVAPTSQLHPRLQELIDFLVSQRREVHDAVAAVPAELRDREPAPGKWSVAEVLEHLTLIEQRVATLLTMRVAAARAEGVGPDPDTSSVVSNFEGADILTNRGKKLVTPKAGVPSGTVGTIAGTEALDGAQVAMIDSLRNANGVSLQNLTAAHPVLGPLNLYHFVVALGLHDVRHAAQIREIGQSLTGG